MIRKNVKQYPIEDWEKKRMNLWLWKGLGLWFILLIVLFVSFGLITNFKSRLHGISMGYLHGILMTILLGYAFHRDVYEHRLREGRSHATLTEIESWEIKHLLICLYPGLILGVVMAGVLVFLHKIIGTEDGFAYGIASNWSWPLILFYGNVFRLGVALDKKQGRKSQSAIENSPT